MNETKLQSLETFRDPAGSLRIEGGRVLRAVRSEYATESITFLESPIARKWMAQRRLIPTVLLQSHADGEVELEHEHIPFPTYPWEWTPGQWVEAATLTLDLAEELLESGKTLKDATPLNVLFDGPKPIFVDVLSIEDRNPCSPLWLAYGQFVRTFLLPLAAYKYLGWPLANALNRRDGYEPADLYHALSPFARWSKPLRSLVTMPYLLEKRQTGEHAQATLSQPPEIAAAVLRRTFHNLRKTLKTLVPSAFASRWSDYTTSADHYSATDHTKKQVFLSHCFEWTHPEAVLDIGGNTGTYSRIAAESGSRVIAWDIDVMAADKSWRTAKEKGLPILPIVADVARPTPATGWRNRETISLLDRARGQFDCVMALGLIHHLLLIEQIPMGEIATLLAELTRKWVIVEWVPPTDVRFRDLLRGRDALYSHLTEETFLSTFQSCFTAVAKEELPNGRVLYLFSKQ